MTPKFDAGVLYSKHVTLGLLADLYHQSSSRPLGAAILESLLAYHRHGDMTVRVGVSKDQMLTVFSTNDDLAKLIAQTLASAVVRVLSVPTMSSRQFGALLLCNEDFYDLGVKLCGGVRPIGASTRAVLADDWSEESAIAYLDRIAESEPSGSQLRQRMSAAVRSEGATRNVLNETFGWKAEHLDVVIRDLRGPLSTLVRLYGAAETTPLGSMLLETVAAMQEHGDRTARLGVNMDGSVNVFACDESIGRSVAEAVRWHALAAASLAVHTMGDEVMVALAAAVKPSMQVRTGSVAAADHQAFAKLAWDVSTSSLLNEPGEDPVEHRPEVVN